MERGTSAVGMLGAGLLMLPAVVDIAVASGLTPY